MVTMTLAQVFDQDFVTKLAGAVLLVVLDLAFGVIRALRLRQFEWSKVGDFYLTTVLPYLLGWCVLHVAVKVVALLALADVTPIIPATISTGAFAILVLALGSQVLEKVRDVFGKVPGQ